MIHNTKDLKLYDFGNLHIQFDYNFNALTIKTILTVSFLLPSLSPSLSNGITKYNRVHQYTVNSKNELSSVGRTKTSGDRLRASGR